MHHQIRKLRLKANISQGWLAKKLGFHSQSTIAMWESGDRKPQSDILPALAEALGCKIEDLFRVEEANQ